MHNKECASKIYETTQTNQDWFGSFVYAITISLAHKAGISFAHSGATISKHFLL